MEKFMHRVVKMEHYVYGKILLEVLMVFGKWSMFKICIERRSPVVFRSWSTFFFFDCLLFDLCYRVFACTRALSQLKQNKNSQKKKHSQLSTINIYLSLYLKKIHKLSFSIWMSCVVSKLKVKFNYFNHLEIASFQPSVRFEFVDSRLGTTVMNKMNQKISENVWRLK